MLTAIKRIIKTLTHQIIDILYPYRNEYIDHQNKWSLLKECPYALYDAASVLVGDDFYIIGGYTEINKIHHGMVVYNIVNDDWYEINNVPKYFCHSHSSVCSDQQRYIYIVSGQIGPQCAPAVSNAFCFDTITKKWTELPPLPLPRYAGTMQLIDNVLHFVGGAEEDRVTPSNLHWCLAVHENKALWQTWEEREPAPLAVMHRGSIAFGGELFVFSGQQGDFKAMPNSQNYNCTNTTQEIFYKEVHKFNPAENKWYRLRDIPIPTSHTDFSVVEKNGVALIMGGNIYKDPVTYRIRLTNVIQAYHLREDCWQIAGRLPYRVKALNCCLHHDDLIIACGQRDYSSNNDSPNRVINIAWKCSFSSLDLNFSVSESKSNIHHKSIMLLTHEISYSGAPLFLLEVCKYLKRSGANVQVYTLRGNITHDNIFTSNHIPILPFEKAMEAASESDLIIANTAYCGPLIRKLLNINPALNNKLIWWIHENDYMKYNDNFLGLKHVKFVLFDSTNQCNTWKYKYFSEKTNCTVIYPGLRESIEKASYNTISEQERIKLRYRYGLDPKDFVLLIIGEFSDRKGQSLLLKTVGNLAKSGFLARLKVQIIGFENEKQKNNFYKKLHPFEKQVISNGKLLWTKKAELSEHYAISDVFVMNSQGYGEPFGLVTLEAMAFKLPILATDAGGTKEIIVENQNGLYHPIGLEGQSILSSNIELLARDVALRKKLGNNGRKHVVEHFSSSRFFTEFDSYINNINI